MTQTGKNIRLLRTQAEMQQQELAARAGIERERMCAIENGWAEPEDTELEAICKALTNHYPFDDFTQIKCSHVKYGDYAVALQSTGFETDDENDAKLSAGEES